METTEALATHGTSLAAPQLTVRGVSKRYGGARALESAELTIDRPGTVLALCGENGCGKSTLLRILAGQTRPDDGQIEIDGSAVAFASPHAAIDHGVVTVTQEISLALDLSVAENVYLGHRMSRGIFGINWRRTIADARELLARVGVDLDPTATVRSLRPDQQQMVEIVRALSMDARILILDEPTSSLSDDEVDALLDRVRRLADTGVSTIFVSHRLNEVFRVASHIAVLRDGRLVSQGPVSDYDETSLVEAMVGAHQPNAVLRPAARTTGRAVLRLDDVTVPDLLNNVSLEVAEGEIVGLAGLVGAGRSALLETVFGLHRLASGVIEIDGEPFSARTPVQAIAGGVGYVPADRKQQGLLLGMGVRQNLSMSATAHRARIRPHRSAEERQLARDYVASMRIKAPSPETMVSTLSGGNQQKVVVGKWLATNPRVLLLDEPTRGVDVGAKAELHRLLVEAADSGMGVLVSSSETPELLSVCDRIAVMYRGEIRAVLPRAEATEANIAHYAGGHA